MHLVSGGTHVESPFGRYCVDVVRPAVVLERRAPRTAAAAAGLWFLSGIAPPAPATGPPSVVVGDSWKPRDVGRYRLHRDVSLRGQRRLRGPVSHMRRCCAEERNERGGEGWRVVLSRARGYLLARANVAAA